MDVNLNSAYYVMQAALPEMQSVKAAPLVYISSISSRALNPLDVAESVLAIAKMPAHAVIPGVKILRIAL